MVSMQIRKKLLIMPFIDNQKLTNVMYFLKHEKSTIILINKNRKENTFEKNVNNTNASKILKY